MQVVTTAGDAAGPVVSRSWPQFFERWNASGYCGWRCGGSRRQSWLATLLCHAMQAAATVHSAANTVVDRGCQTFFEMQHKRRPRSTTWLVPLLVTVVYVFMKYIL